jgi:molybdate transport repressor ModE-like protein/molybdopterin-binding protein
VTERARAVTDTDVALLRMLSRERSVVAASRSVGISRDRATYRLARLERAFGGPVVESIRGGRGHGESRLTALGDRIVRQGFDSVEMMNARPLAPPTRSNLLRGIYHRRPAPEVSVGRGLNLRVAFPAEEGERVSLLIDPEAILVARKKFVSSARNVLPATIEEVRPGAGSQGWTLVVHAGPARLRVAVTEEPVHQLALAPGARVWLYVKATAVRRVGRTPGASTRGSPRR